VTAARPLLRARVGPALVWCSDASHGNVGDHVGDDPVRVARNRAGIARAAGLPAPDAWVWLRQVHGADVYDAGAPTPVTSPPEADAAATGAHGLPLAIVTADCAPVVLANDGALAVVHAGHRGLANGVIDAAVAEVRARGTGDVRAFLGPCIHPDRYEFGAADLAPLVEIYGPDVAGCTADRRPALDIPAAVRIALARLGIVDLADVGVCTSARASYFSHRRDGATGRQLTVAVLP
jgi:YfiH family protein